MIPVHEPSLPDAAAGYVAECITSGWVSSEGPFVARFEQVTAHAVERRHAVAVSSGSAALEVAVAALGIGPGDEVIMPTFTIISCAAAVIRAGATPVLVDSDPVTWNMDAQQVAARVTERTRALMIVHMYGLPADVDALLTIAAEHDLLVIEDAAQMLGQTYRDRPCGSFGTVSTLSFYANKQVTTGEGGMLLTDDPAIAQRCRSLRNLCFDERARFRHEELGWNFRMSNLQAALGLAGVEEIATTVDRKRRLGQAYSELLKDLPGIELPLQITDYAHNIYWVYGLVLSAGSSFDATAVMGGMGQRGIGTRPFFWPMHEQPVFATRGLFTDERYPVAERLARNGLYLPSGTGLGAEQLHVVARALTDVLSELRASNDDA